MMKFKPEIEKALVKINFVEKYEALSNSSREVYDLEEIIVDLDKLKIEEIFNELGYTSKYVKKENFYKVGEYGDKKDIYFAFHISINVDVLEFIWVVYHNNELRLGMPWAAYSRLLISPNTIIKPPLFSDYGELKKILVKSLEMYEQFKDVLIEEYM
ncbi:hypothetical protein [Bacillus aquiflavi]|nr:hypothetical protein [Bacillus aquiflavi]